MAVIRPRSTFCHLGCGQPQFLMLLAAFDSYSLLFLLTVPELRILWIPPIISGTGKATNFQFCTHIHDSSDRLEQKPIKDFGKVAVGVVRDSQKCLGHPHIGG